jgi:hypothetical protein
MRRNRRTIRLANDFKRLPSFIETLQSGQHSRPSRGGIGDGGVRVMDYAGPCFLSVWPAALM